MSPLRQFLSSTIGTKILIALTGLAFFAYLIIHLAGNLLIFVGGDAFNEYAHKMTGNALLPIIEIGLVAVMLLVGMHLRHAIWSACQTLGLEHPRYNKIVRVAGLWLAIIIAGGFAVIPIWIYVTGGRS